MIPITVDENLVTDLKSAGINISKSAIDSISYDIDIQNSNIQSLNITKWQDMKGRFVLISNSDNNVIAIYNKDRFDYNPNKLKNSDIINYECWEVINNMGSVVDKRNSRIQSRLGYTDLSKSNKYNKPPKSTRYVLDRDWNINASREYYTKLLHQNRLGKYAERLDYTYTIMQELITHRYKEQTVGKKGVYTNWIKKLASQIEVAETLMDALDKNINPDIPKLLKGLNSLEKVTNDAKAFLGYEDDTIATFGYTKQRPHAKIER